MTDYTTLAALKKYLAMPEADTLDNTELARVITSASAQIDHLCSRTFEPQVDPAVLRFSEPWFDRDVHRWVLPIDDLFTLTDLDVRTWNATTGDWSDPVTVTERQMLADGPIYQVTGARAWTGIVLPEGTAYRPGGPYDDATAVAVTARYGWPSTPAGVEQACLILAARAFARRESRFGVVNSLDGSEIDRLTRAVDPDAVAALRGYIKYWAVAG